MTESEKAAHVAAALRSAAGDPPAEALAKLNALIGLTKSAGEADLELEEARSAAFMAVCEVGKALHRGQPVEQLWQRAIAASELWRTRAG